jgi:hypothetical protein
MECPIYLGTRPSDNTKILLENQISAVEGQWTKAGGTHGQFLAGHESYEKYDRIKGL